MTRRRTPGLMDAPAVETEAYMAVWSALSPAERLRRSWRLRRRLKDPEAVHDAKTFPEL